MGRDTADVMDEAWGEATYSCPWLPLRGISGSHGQSETWAGCMVSPTALVKTLLNASRSVSWRCLTEKASRDYAASYFLNLLPTGDYGT
jgi:hypothetical protein